MKNSVPEDATGYLVRLSDGDESAASALLPMVYREMRRLAASYLSHERPDHTLQPTALVHEAYLKLVNQDRARWNDRAHFFAVAAEAMKRILIDHARGRTAQKRDHRKRVTLDMASDVPETMEVDLVALDAALESLGDLSERQRRVVDLRFFGGLTVEEAAEVLDVSPRTVKGDWRLARAWLQRELNRDTPS